MLTKVISRKKKNLNLSKVGSIFHVINSKSHENYILGANIG